MTYFLIIMLTILAVFCNTIVKPEIMDIGIKMAVNSILIFIGCVAVIIIAKIDNHI